MIGIEIYPPEAKDYGCTANASVLDVEDDITYYQLKATVGAGCEFDHFEWTQHVQMMWDEGEEEYHYDNHGSSTNTTTTNRDSLCEFHSDSGDFTITATITYCRAVFKVPTGPIPIEESSITVTTSAEPDEAGVTEPTSSTKKGIVGTKITFEISAEPREGKKFVKWTGDGAVEFKTKVATVELTFLDEDSEYEFVAHFTDIGKILHGAAGTILHGASGSILFDDLPEES